MSFIGNYTRLNDKIRATKLRVIDQDGAQLGVMSREEAISAARQADLDLVEISPKADPPVAKIIDWGKYNYQKTKQIQKNKRSTKPLELKQMRVGLKISDHDLEVKAKKVRKFLTAGHKVKYTLRFRGRELAHRDVGFTLAQKIIDGFGESIVVDQRPQFAGRQINFVMRISPAAKIEAEKATKAQEKTTKEELKKENKEK